STPTFRGATLTAVNRYRERRWDTLVGTIGLSIPNPRWVVTRGLELGDDVSVQPPPRVHVPSTCSILVSDARRRHLPRLTPRLNAHWRCPPPVPRRSSRWLADLTG